MSNPTRIPMIVGGVVGIVALAICLFLPKDEQKDPSLQNTKPTTGIQIHVPTSPTDSTEIPPIVIIPGDDDPVDPTDPIKPQPGDPFVEDGDEEEEIKNPPTDGEEVIPDDKVTDTGKNKDEEQDVSQGEIRNDAVLEEKEGAEEQLPPEEEHEVIVEDEQTTVGGEKGEVHEDEDKPNHDGDESNKNAPEYEESPGGDNPFDDDTETEIEDTPVEDLIGEDEERPGEGTHF